MAGGSNASASATAKGKNKKNPIGAGGANDRVVGGIPSSPGLFTCVPLDLPTAHSPMDIDHEAESVSVAPPIPMQHPPHIERSRKDHKSDGDDEDMDSELFFELFAMPLGPEFEMRMRGLEDEIRARASAKGKSREKPTDVRGTGDSDVGWTSDSDSDSAGCRNQ